MFYPRTAPMPNVSYVVYVVSRKFTYISRHVTPKKYLFNQVMSIFRHLSLPGFILDHLKGKIRKVLGSLWPWRHVASLWQSAGDLSTCGGMTSVFQTTTDSLLTSEWTWITSQSSREYSLRSWEQSWNNSKSEDSVIEMFISAITLVVCSKYLNGVVPV